MGTEPLGLGLTALQLVRIQVRSVRGSRHISTIEENSSPRRSSLAPLGLTYPAVVHYQTSIWINGVKVQT